MNDGRSKLALDDIGSPHPPPAYSWSRGAIDRFLAERERWVLWLPVLIGIGIGVYFSLPEEPPRWVAWIAPAVAIVATAVARKQPALLLFTLSATCIAVGFSISVWRTAAIEAPLLERRIGPIQVNGRVEAVEPRPNGIRATLREVCQRRSKSTPLAGVKMHHLMRFSPALAVVPVVHRRDPRCFV